MAEEEEPVAEAEASEKAARRVACSVGRAKPMTSCDSCVPGDVGDAAVRAPAVNPP
jgi:hypothetical protein